MNWCQTIPSRSIRPVALAVTLLAGSASLSEPTPESDSPLSFGADIHVHLTMSRQARVLFDGEPGSGRLTWNPNARLRNQVDETHLRLAGVKLVFAALWPPNPTRPHRSALDEAFSQVDELESFVARQPGFRLVTSAFEARQAIDRGFIAVFPQLEGGEGITRVEDVDALFGAGIRVLTVVHFADSELGGAANGQLARNVFGATAPEDNARGLSEFGRAVVARAFEVGMLVDVAHGSEALMRDVLSMAELKGIPVINSHTGARALTDLERNLSAPLATRIAGVGGVIGITLYADQLHIEKTGRVCDDVASHWRALEAAAPGAVVLGSDLNSFISRARPGGLCPDGIRNTSDLPVLWRALGQSGVKRESLTSMGEKVLNVVEAVEAKSNEAARQQAASTRRLFLQRNRSHFPTNW